ncbi:RsmB/NOP family class I SAM-dependent RNA methyltransferase [Gallaecimonas sp. GXIMD1310]|uniref:RsmB/NOP family class I SAM-dependent RNA methyltransferase n=1 Tax=Gallaecimonas sp. GXIMD1310 TaxID=3131926 RepID=UPI00325160F8
MVEQELIKVLAAVLIDGHPLDKALNRADFATEAGIAIPGAQHLVRYARRYAALAGLEWPARPVDLQQMLALWAYCEKPQLALPRTKPAPQRLAQLQAQPAVWHSYPDWLYARLGPALAEALNRPPRQHLRANTLKTEGAALRQQLAREGIDSQLLADNALLLPHFAPVFRSQAFHQGLFEQQDIGSQQLAAVVAAQPGMTVIDACAGAGGKTLALAAQMHNKGRLLALDIVPGKLQALKKRARRAGVHNLETRVIEGATTIKRLKGKADRLLLDVPCSGTGVLRRNPDSKWQLQADDVRSLCQTQAQILDSYSRMVKVGGELVYGTCSVLPEENLQQVEAFLARSQGRFKLLDSATISPLAGDTDGFFWARLQRQD